MKDDAITASRGRQAAIADLGLRALRSHDEAELARVFLTRVQEELGADAGTVLAVSARDDRLAPVAAAGWEVDALCAALSGSDLESLARTTLAEGTEVRVPPPDASRSLSGRPLLRERGLAGGIAVVVHGGDEPYGIMSLHALEARAFDRSAAEFLRSAADLLAEAIRRIESERSASRLAERLASTLESMPAAFFTVDRQWRFSYMNAEAERILQRSRDELLGRDVWREFPQAVGTRIEGEYRRATRTGTAAHFEEYYEPLGVWLHIAAYPSPEGLAVYFHDVSERHRTEDRNRLYRTFHATLAEITQESLLGKLDDTYFDRVLEAAVRLVPGADAGSLMQREPDGDWTFLAVSGFGEALKRVRIPAANRTAGLGTREAIVAPGYAPDPKLDEATHGVLVGPAGRSREIRSVLIVPVWLQDDLVAYLNLDSFTSGDAYGADSIELGKLFARQIGSVMQRMRLEQDLVRQARTDVVTGIPNRRHAEDVMGAWIAEGRAGALLFLDLDDFKHVNEAYGHAFGDEFLRVVAGTLESVLPPDALIARWGGDEFLVASRGLAAAGDAVAIADAIEAVLRQPALVHDRPVTTSGSIGVVLFGQGIGSVEQAVVQADIALTQAKKNGKSRSMLFVPDMETGASRRFALEDGLRTALDVDDPNLDVHFQVRVDVASGRTVATEALSRWTHPTLGAIAPIEFIPVAEATGLIRPLTRRVLDRACAQARAWLDAGSPLVVSVNLSAACIRHDDTIRDVQNALERHDLPAEWLELEVTETAAVTGAETSIARLRDLRRLGVSISIDDFGVAYSSLSYLKLLPVDVLKVDRSFLADLGDGGPSRNASILEGIVALGRSLGLFVVAEGVETEAHVAFLRRIGCDGAQGYYYGRPGPADRLGERA